MNTVVLERDLSGRYPYWPDGFVHGKWTVADVLPSTKYDGARIRMLFYSEDGYNAPISVYSWCLRPRDSWEAYRKFAVAAGVNNGPVIDDASLSLVTLADVLATVKMDLEGRYSWMFFSTVRLPQLNDYAWAGRAVPVLREHMKLGEDGDYVCVAPSLYQGAT